MSFPQLASSYLTHNFLIVIGCSGFLIISVYLRRANFSLLLKLQYVSLASICCFTLLHFFLPLKGVFQPAAKVWSASSLNSFSTTSNFTTGGYLSFADSPAKGVAMGNIALALTLVAGFLVIFAIGKVLWEIYFLERIKAHAQLLRRLGPVSIYSHPNIVVPFSFWSPGRANIIMPEAILARPEAFRIALIHELQHHRQHDTKWIYLIWGLRVFSFWNPLLHFWGKRILEIQEFACDEALLGRRRVEPQAYASCLFEVAKSALQQKNGLACATGLTFLVERNLLKRRIEQMLQSSEKKIGRKVALTFCAGLIGLMVTTAFAAKGLVQDRRVSLAQARVLAERAREGSSFPIVLNDLVLAELNKYIGTPEGREFMRLSLLRMENYRSMVTGKIGEYNLPNELMAVPIIESGYQNLAERNQIGWGAGLWMFIKTTARVYGLRVDESVDERLNEALLTDAAMRYLRSNHLRFNDWHLALLAYNIGERNVQNAIDSTGSRNAWVLIQRGFENDKNYLPKLMAAILIMKSPESIN